MILIMETILELNGTVEERHYAAKLKVHSAKKAASGLFKQTNKRGGERDERERERQR